VSPIEEVVDAAMQYLPSTINLSLPEDRAKVRQWMLRICARVTEHNINSFKDAAASAIEEAGALAINPQYYQERSDRRRKYKAQRAIAQVANKPKTRAEMAFERLQDAPVKM
jgi:hypothetical protein